MIAQKRRRRVTYVRVQNAGGESPTFRESHESSLHSMAHQQQQRVLIGLCTATLLYWPVCDGFALPALQITKLSRAAAAAGSHWAQNQRLITVFQQADDTEFLADELIDADVSSTRNRTTCNFEAVHQRLLLRFAGWCSSSLLKDTSLTRASHTGGGARRL
jgi:hypothetical protein